MAKFKGGGLEKSIAKQLAKNIDKALARGIQSATIEVMNGLVKAGPAWSGEFSASWRFIPDGQDGGAPGQKGSIYRYSKKDVNIKIIEKYISDGIVSFQLVNTSDHASIAIDETSSSFTQPGTPLKPNKFTGWRPLNDSGTQANHLRGDLAGADFRDGVPGTATAPLDWYVTYVLGGAFSSDFGNGFSIGFGV